MNTRSKPGYTAVLLIAAALILQSCATIVKGTRQKIPVTSAPIGARVLVDGKDMGRTPLTLMIKRNKPGVIRIEKEGFNPYEIHIKRKQKLFSTSVIGSVSIGIPVGLALGPKLVNENDPSLIAFGWMRYFLYAGLVAVAVALPFGVVDIATGAIYSLSPKSLDVVLTPTGGTSRLELTEIDASQLRDVKWLRIRTASPKDRN